MLLYLQPALLLALYGLVQAGIVFDFNNTIWWWDVLMHFGGGVWAGMFVVWFLRKLRMRPTIVGIVGSVLVIGVIWEVFEVHVGIDGSAFLSYWPDTSKDLFMDSLGSGIAYNIARYIRT